jgi:hypothetical protein
MSSRFRYPIEWSMFLFAGYLLYRVVIALRPASGKDRARMAGA